MNCPTMSKTNGDKSALVYTGVYAIYIKSIIP
jgi:hypothetical protein